MSGELWVRIGPGALIGAEITTQAIRRALDSGPGSQAELTEYEKARKNAFRAKQGVTALVQLFVQYPAMLEYAIPRISARGDPRDALSSVLGDVADPRDFLNLRMLWASLRP